MKNKKKVKKIHYVRIAQSLKPHIPNKTQEFFDKKKNVKKYKLSDKVPTGIKVFDLITKGGFEKNSSNLIVGDTGSGKTIFGVQFLIEGIKNNENCLYLTFEEQKETFYQNMKELGWDLDELEKKGKFFFLEYNPKKVRDMLEEGGGFVENLIIRKKITRMIIDSITSFVILFEREIEKRETVLSLFNMLRKWNCTTLLIYEGNPLKKELDSDVLEFESDSIIFLYFIRRKRERNRFLEVIKMRGSKHSKKIYPFEIDEGIKINDKPFIGKLSED